ncbi:MAG: hypothetical protein HYU86_10470 [Chloroflexi bacterium]|nr:hypothetical protein [Chloroflexota bacterium]
MESGGIRKDFFNLYTYATWSAFSKNVGVDPKQLPDLVAEVAFDEIQKELNLVENEPGALLKRLAQYFHDVGFADITATPTGENVFLYETVGIGSAQAAEKLREEGSVTPGISMRITWAGVRKQCHMKVVTKSLPADPTTPEKGRSQWTLVPI